MIIKFPVIRVQIIFIAVTYTIDAFVDLEHDRAFGFGVWVCDEGVHGKPWQLTRQLEHMELSTERQDIYYLHCEKTGDQVLTKKKRSAC